MLFLDGVYVDGANGSSVRFQRTKAPTSAELTQLAHAIAHRVGGFLRRQGLLERDYQNGYLADNASQAGPLDQLPGHSIPSWRAKIQQPMPAFATVSGAASGRLVRLMQQTPQT